MELDERLESGDARRPLRRGAARALQPQGGAAGIGWPEAGRIEPGALADLVTVGLDGVRLAGTPPEHAIESVVFAAGAGDVREVIVGGEFVVRDGAHLSLDVAGELGEAIAMLPS